MRRFEKISFAQFQKDFEGFIQKEDMKTAYEEYSLPVRGTKRSAGYDIFTLFDFVVKPGENMTIPTGLKVVMNPDEFLGVYNRSSSGFKYNVRLRNQVGIIDSDFYNNPDNEGHMRVGIKNEGHEDWVVQKGKGIAQGIFHKFLLVDEDDLDTGNKRLGGVGSTDSQ